MPKSKNGLIGALLVISLVGGVMVGAYVVNTPEANHVSDSLRRPKPAPDVTGSLQHGNPHTLHARMVGSDLVFDQHDATIPSGADPIVWVVNEFLKDSRIAPPTARLLGADVR